MQMRQHTRNGPLSGTGRVCRRKLRAHLVTTCAEHGVKYLEGEVTGIEGDLDAEEVRISLEDGGQVTSRYVA